MKELVSEIERVIGNNLEHAEFLETALTHRSFVNESGSEEIKDNERMEFLGDAVLNLQVSNLLMDQYPDDDEGVLSKYRSAIVNEKSLALAARRMSLGSYLKLGKGEELTQGREKDSILADAFEAVVAAVYLSSGEGMAYRFVQEYLSEAIDRVSQNSERHDFKTTLQEFTQKWRKTTPVYRLVSEDGPDHEKWFESEVLIDQKVYGRGRAKSKKDSEQRCAEVALQLLQEEVGALPK